MKKLLYTLFLIVATTRLFALSGGPDLFGYTWKDSNEPGGPTFQWVDIISSDREITGMGDDNVRGPFSTSVSGYNPFKFYWYPVDKIWVGANGFISFDCINLSSVFPAIPDSTDNKHNFISAILADLMFSGVGNPAKCYCRVTTDSIIISWINVPFYSATPPYYTGSNTFQIILDKIDYSITVNFLSSSGTTLNSDIKTGMENITGNIGLQPFTGIYPPANYTIKYYYPANPTYFVTDGSARWNSQYGNGGLFIPYPTSFDLKANIQNTGNLKIPPVYTATGKVNEFTGPNVVTTSVNFNDTLYSSQDTTFTYPAVFIPSSLGTHSYITTLSGVLNDAFQTNNSVTQEIVVVDTSLFSYELNFSDNVLDGGLAWTDGTGGIGVYFAPPEYPVKVLSTKFFIQSNLNNSKFIAKIYDDDGQDGTPGTLLDSVMVMTVGTGIYNTVPTNNYVVIPNGGIYVLWEMYGTEIYLAKDTTRPISLRTYEYVAQVWSEYRSSQAEDFLIGVNVQRTQIEDVGIKRIVTPLNNSVISSPTTVSCRIKNYGQLAKTNFPVNYQLYGIASPVTETYTGTAIPPNDSVLYQFATQIQPAVSFTGKLCVWTDMNFDFDLNNDTSCITVQITTDIEDYQQQGIVSVYPNPFDDKTTIEFTNPDKSKYNMTIIDMLGRVVENEYGITGNKFTLEKGKLSPGIYTLELTGKRQYREKIIIR